MKKITFALILTINATNTFGYGKPGNSAECDARSSIPKHYACCVNQSWRTRLWVKSRYKVINERAWLQACYAANAYEQKDCMLDITGIHDSEDVFLSSKRCTAKTLKD